MPILSQPTPDSPLSQGDVLRGVHLYWASPDGLPQEADGDSLALVVSRNCNATRDAVVIVAPVVVGNLQLPAPATFDGCLRYFTMLRDGAVSPDRLYLGEFEGQRRLAQFDRLHSVSIPTLPKARSEFVNKHRVARLETAFVHDLHQRLFRAFASLGFDDHGWWSNDDLDVIIRKADAEVSPLQTEVAQMASDIDVLASGSRDKAQDRALEGRREALQKKREAIAAFNARVDPFRRERERRR